MARSKLRESQRVALDPRLHYTRAMKTILGITVLLGASTATADPLAATAHEESSAAIAITPSVLVGGEAFHYAEEVPLPLKSKHDAWLPTVRLGVDATALGGHLFARAAFTATYASMTYDGSTQTGDALSGHTTGNLTDTELDLGGQFHAGPLVLGGYVGAAHHTWNRDFRATMPGGYREEFTWNYLPVGLEAAVAVHDLSVRADAAFLMTLPGNDRAYYSDVSTMFADADVPVATGGGVRVRALASYPITAALSALGSVSYENDISLLGPGVPFMYSNGTPVVDTNGDALGAAYPGAKTSRTSVMVGAAYGF
jgi:hypothetical protein